MARFIKTANGLHVLSTEIVRLQKCGVGKSLIKTKRDEYHVVKGLVLDDLKRIIEDDTAKIIPAAPGYSVAFLLWPTRNSEKWRTVVVPVVGWRLTESSCDVGQIYESAPVTAGAHDISTVWAIVLPDGKLLSRWSDLPVSMEDWIYDEKIAADLESVDFPGGHGGEDENIGVESD
ncbi:hypothetical protein AMST5_03379 [freshwater sediment metagenome]|uniref:Uncharacterized protein n=1 Tax=freshwater sediment metagenome TaxID=556182 RepID=A0AA48RAH1_9ZZZZ